MSPTMNGTDWTKQTSPILGPQAQENTFRWATVTVSSPLQIQLDGDSLPLPLVPESLIEAPAPAPGSRVWVQLFGRRVIVLGVSSYVSDLGNMTSYVPTLTNAVLGAGALSEGHYTQIGDLVFWQFRFQFGTSPSFSDDLQVSLPTLAWNGGGTHLQAACGSWLLRIPSGVFHYAGTLGTWGTTGTGGTAVSASFDGAFDGTSSRRRLGNSNVGAAPELDGVLSGSGTYRVG